jgi:hypothetical protein
MASHDKTQSGFNRRSFLAGAATGSAMLPVAARAAGSSKKRGIFADPPGTFALQDKVADFTYQNDVLAQLIVEIWAGAHPELITPSGPGTLPAKYLQRSSNAQTVLAERDIYLSQPIVITEDEYDDGFSLANAGLSVPDAVVFVVPRNTRPTTGKPLLETAKMLMAVTPNGI